MTLRTSPLTIPEQIQDIYEQLRRRHAGISIQDVTDIVQNNPCECDCFEITAAFPFEEAGTVTVHTGALRTYLPYPCRITSIRASVNTAPTGSSIIIDVNKNGSTIFTASQNPEILVGDFTALAAGISDPNLALGDYLQFDVDQAGSTIAGADLSITLGLLVPCGSFALSAPPPVFPDPCSPDSIAGITGLTVWLKADALALSDGDKIGTWPDSSGNGHDGTQATDDFKMIFKTNIQNGLPVARLANPTGPQWVDFGDLSASFPTAATLIVLYKPNNGGHVVYWTSANDSWWNYSGTQAYYGPFRNPRVETYPSAPAANNAWDRVAVVSSSSTYQVYYDNVGQGAKTAAYLAGTTHRLGTDTLPSRTLTGDIAELLIYNRQLTTGELTTIDDYLVCKWGL